MGQFELDLYQGTTLVAPNQRRKNGALAPALKLTHYFGVNPLFANCVCTAGESR
jgi:hypothetical protein